MKNIDKKLIDNMSEAEQKTKIKSFIGIPFILDILVLFSGLVYVGSLSNTKVLILLYLGEFLLAIALTILIIYFSKHFAKDMKYIFISINSVLILFMLVVIAYIILFTYFLITIDSDVTILAVIASYMSQVFQIVLAVFIYSLSKQVKYIKSNQ